MDLGFGKDGDIGRLVMVEYTDILIPPTFEPSGETKPIYQAIDEGDWIGVMNLWLVRSNGNIVYQMRPPSGGWEPGKLDGSVGGYLRAGESGLDGVREAKEELGFMPDLAQVTKLGRHLSVGVDSMSRRRHLVVSVYMMICDIPLEDFKLQSAEVPAIFDIHANDIISIFRGFNTHLSAAGVDSNGKRLTRDFNQSNFSYIFGGYHLKIAQIANEYAAGRTDFWY